MTRTARTLALLVLAASMLVPGASAASAMSASEVRTFTVSAAAAAIPSPVREWMATKAVDFVVDSSAGSGSGAPHLSTATSIGTVRRVQQWSTALYAGQVSGTPLAATTTWIASLHGSSGVLGVVTASLPAGTDTVTGAFSTDVELGRALDRITGAGVPVQDPTVGEWFVVNGSRIAALNARARAELPSPTLIDSFQSVVAARMTPAGSDGEGTRTTVILLVAVGILAVVVVVGGFLFWRRVLRPRRLRYVNR